MVSATLKHNHAREFIQMKEEYEMKEEYVRREIYRLDLTRRVNTRYDLKIIGVKVGQ